MAKQNSSDRVKELLSRAEAGIHDFLSGEKYKLYLHTMAQFHNYSARNCMLILMQRPDATLVAGYNAWQSKFKRQVLKGEKGMQIIAYSTRTIVSQQERKDENGNLVYNENGEVVIDQIQKKVPRFVPTYVWDVAQTDGEPLPQIGVELTGSVHEYRSLLDAIKEVSAFEVIFEDIPGDAKGYCDHDAKKIVIQTGMSESQTVKTAIHELAHSIMHDGRTDLDRNTKEVQAESVAFAVCDHYGIDTADYSFPYLASWSSNTELKELQASLDAIQKVTNSLIYNIDKRFEEILAVAEKNQPEASIAPDISSEQTLREHWEAETSDPITHQWRDNLSDEDVKLVASWDLNATPIEPVISLDKGYHVYPLSEEVAAKNLQTTTGWNLYKLIDHDGNNEDSWIVYRQLEDLPDVLRSYVQDDAKFTIYQLKQDRSDNLFMAYAKTPEIRFEDYEPVWTDTYPDGWSLEGIYTKFNIDRPAEFQGHSLSVSDIVVIQRGQDVTAHFVDTIGFQSVPDFARSLQQVQHFGQEINTTDPPQQAIPVYRHSRTYAIENNEIADYRASNELNVACKTEIEEAIANHYSNNRLGSDVADKVIERFGQERVTLVLAATISQLLYDGRISNDNKSWAVAITDSYGVRPENHVDYIVTRSHPGLLDMVATQVRTKLMNRQEEEILDTVRYDGEPDLDKEPARPSFQDRLAAAQAEADRRNSAQLSQQEVYQQK